MRIIYESFDVNVDYSRMNTCFFFYIEEKVNVSKRSGFIKWWNVINCNKYGVVQRFQMRAFLKIFFFFSISLISLLKYFYIRNKKKIRWKWRNSNHAILKKYFSSTGIEFFFLLIELNNALCMRILWNWNIKAIHQSFFAKARDVAGTNYAEYCTVVGKSIKR